MPADPVPYEAGGRVDQKQRTRAALVQAARELVARGQAPTVEDAATHASVSRTTAYRYFRDQQALLLAAHPETGVSSLLPPDPPAAVEARLGAVVAEFIRIIVETESQQRTMLRLSLQAQGDSPPPSAALPLRQGRAIGWISEALAPLRGELSEPEIHRLALAIRSAIGIEALAWLTDVAGLSRPEAVEVMTWSARAMLNSAATGSPPPI
jgi:hypothetical protein